MPFDEQLRRAFDTLSDHLRDELARHLDQTAADLRDTAQRQSREATEAARREYDEALANTRRDYEQALEAAARDRDEALAAATRERDEALEATRQDHEQALAAAALDREQALESARQEHEHSLTAAAQEYQQALEHIKAQYEQALADASADRDAAIAAAADDAARHAREQALADAERDLESRIADAAGVAEAHGRESAATEAQGRIQALESQLQETEQRARAAQEASRVAAEHAAAAARDQAHEPDTAALLERIVESIRAIDGARSLTAILDTLVDCAAREAPRAGVLLTRGGVLRAFRFAGFGNHFDQSHAFDIQYADAGILADAIHRLEPVTTDTGSTPSFAGLPPGRRAVAVPLLLGGEAVGVLYGDEGDPGAAADARFAERLELLARHASSALEAMTAFKAAHALVRSAPVTPRSSADADPKESARRYARLLVSEIKLYHEADVLAGRRERNLVARLGPEIDRARRLYEERVPASVRSANDFFHSELVRTLASGDPSLLGV